MQITNFSTPTCNKIQEEMEKALAMVAKKYQLTIEFRGGKYTDTDFTPKIVVSLKSLPTYNDKFITILSMLGLPADAIGKTFQSQEGRTMTIIDINTRATKMPVICKCKQDGKSYKFSVSQINRVLN